jgi:hypothetical protein
MDQSLIVRVDPGEVEYCRPNAQTRPRHRIHSFGHHVGGEDALPLEGAWLCP